MVSTASLMPSGTWMSLVTREINVYNVERMFRYMKPCIAFNVWWKFHHPDFSWLSQRRESVFLTRTHQICLLNRTGGTWAIDFCIQRVLNNNEEGKNILLNQWPHGPVLCTVYIASVGLFCPSVIEVGILVAMRQKMFKLCGVINDAFLIPWSCSVIHWDSRTFQKVIWQQNTLFLFQFSGYFAQHSLPLWLWACCHLERGISHNIFFYISEHLWL